MPDQPYTDADLRTEAARQLKNTTEDPDFGGIGEQMEGERIPSRDDVQWDQLDDTDFDTAMRAIDGLLGTAADTSEWAVNLGADGLKPGGHLDLDTSHGRLRLLFAWEPTAPPETRDKVTADLIGAIGPVIPIR